MGIKQKAVRVFSGGIISQVDEGKDLTVERVVLCLIIKIGKSGSKGFGDETGKDKKGT
ncbi:hypothetical protein HCBG_00221 [Histoplasma capsulatum G186AR]|uniref:Uncharacterized protein n=1 Tax=Ajellomyces capsulatus (strain G186AR / H82 / ATCC MYA-2454 / RMSCC 2432) TaxID=447093 RepID=C0NAS5_AJECG|nr:uncharacterized protein HCBG_00221 [Histoplasma capsulatum G186AR]EEH10766.1 hypothetical protein HCBG_00221 [Histoplasma capsulatum G186AR]